MDKFAHKSGKATQAEALRMQLDELHEEVAGLVGRFHELVRENQRLKKENEKLKDQLVLREGEPVMTQKERLILKQQLMRMIRRLDKHLEEKV